MDVVRAKALSATRRDRPAETCDHLRESGFGDLADEWMTARQAFSSQLGDENDKEVSPAALRAYARMSMSWFRIAQLKEQAIRFLERRLVD